MRRMVMNTSVSINAAPPIGSEIAGRAWGGVSAAWLQRSLGAQVVHMRPSAASGNRVRGCAAVGDR